MISIHLNQSKLLVQNKKTKIVMVTWVRNSLLSECLADIGIIKSRVLQKMVQQTRKLYLNLKLSSNFQLILFAEQFQVLI